ncbi:MAG TPA: MFS transporter [Xanthobacteraceae bacterium]|nr:MFS transporter [Xanthobacteraceae bacterium]
MAEVARPLDAAGGASTASLARAYTLALLTLIYALNFLDRTIFNVLIEPIKKEFVLTDTMLGLLAGFGFVLMYSALGMPIARLADRRNRRDIVTAALAFWSAMTALCGMAQNVAMLACARIGVGIGESAGTPASQSIIADLFAKDERPRALGIFAIGTYLGVFLGYFFGGWVNQYFGWRMAFIGAGIPGIAIALTLRFTVAEPARRHDGAERISNEAIGPTFAFLFSQRSFVLVLIGFCLAGFTNYATATWIPPFMARVHHLSSAEIGTYAGTFKGLFGIAGALLGGFTVARISRDDDRWKVWAPALMSGLAGLVFVLCMLTSRFDVMVWTLGLFSVLVGFHLGPIFAVAQTIAKTSMRALAAATMLLTATCFGQGVGPLAVGYLNDMLKDAYGAEAVRYSLMLAALATVLAALFFTFAAQSIRADIKRAAA